MVWMCSWLNWSVCLGRSRAMKQTQSEQEQRTASPEPPESFQEAGARGKVYLVGAGPGDPDLITVKGLRCLRVANVVVYDRLANSSLLDEASERAELIF